VEVQAVEGLDPVVASAEAATVMGVTDMGLVEATAKSV